MEKFHLFHVNTDQFSLPQKFTFPFNYEPHALAEIAANELQEYLNSQEEWSHNFGFEPQSSGKATGKMFGVLVVQNEEGELGHLWAFSGKLAGRNDHPEFVPPIYDMLDESGFYRVGERELDKLNQDYDDLIQSDEYQRTKDQYALVLEESRKELDTLKQILREKKHKRDLVRKEDPNKEVLEELENESKSDHFLLKDTKRKLNAALDSSRIKVRQFEDQIAKLKKERKTKSANLQRRLFESYELQSAFGVSKTVLEIFDTHGLPTPSGAGECAAPKLLQFAYINKLKPIALAEFWWGNPPEKEVRKHGQFYPACKSKCEPILSHMMKGLNVEPNPLLQDPQHFELDIIHEDEEIIVINKQSGLLSVPGKTDRQNVLDLVMEKFHDLRGPVIVHRLDMSTSGIMILAKNEKAYHMLQEQFARRIIKKRYLAELTGRLKEKQGSINLPLRVDLDNRPRQLVCFEHGKDAYTRWEYLREKDGNTLVYFYPETGRTHQLRVHASHKLGLNAPIVGDELYGKAGKRLHLHAEFIEFKHPKSDDQISFSAPPTFL